MNYFTMLIAAAPVTPAPPGAGSMVSTVWDMAVRGGWSMIPIAICSLVAMTIVVERWIITRRARVAPPALLESVLALKRQPAEARARCEASTSPLAAVLVAAIRAAPKGREAQERAIADEGERALRLLRKRMRLLSALPQTATMLGLLGTVVGMIRTFTVVAASADSLGKTERLAQGIHEAWTATAGGLIVAVPTLIAFQLLLARIDAAAEALDSSARVWLDDPETEPKRAPAPSAVIEDESRLVATA